MKSLKLTLALMLLCSTSLVGCTDFADGLEFDAGMAGARADTGVSDADTTDAASDDAS